MFYSLQEAAEKLNKTEEELKQIVKEGKLREFRDGPNLLFKVEEVEALMSDIGVTLSEQAPEPEALEPEAAAPEILEPEALEPEAAAPETLEPEAAAPETLEPEAATPEAPEPEALELEAPAEEPLAPSEQAAGTSEILLSPETGAPIAPSELTDADTALTGEGISVLGETDSDYQVTDDTLAETAVPSGTTGTGPEVPLEEIEEDVNLDSFGSGSGLLDLSLQADDTSLGGILDEIYTSEVEGQEPAPAEVGADSAAVAAEAEQMLAEEEPVVPQLAPEIPAALARPYIEAAPDMQSNTLGMLLFLPLVVILYTTVVAVSGQKGVMPSILPSSIQGLIWYIMGGAFVVTGLFIIAAFMLGGGTVKAAKKPKPKKAPKAKKVKKPKEPKKPKKAKKAKKS